MRVLDLFSGLGGWSSSFKDRGHEVFRVDIETKFECELHKDIFELKPEDIPWTPDIILASPPCEKFSVMRIGRNWTLDNKPRNPEAQLALDLVYRTTELIKELNPKFWVMENPRGKLRKLEVVKDFDRRTVSYCQLGEKFMKPTDLWGGFPPSLVLPEICKRGAPCHIAASRGSITGIQGPKRTKFRGGMIEDMARFPSWSKERHELSALRAKIPYKLSELVCIAAEKDI